jgi:hypothetical protein
MFQNAIYPDSPNGVLDRIRLDKITVVPDGALPLAGGLPSNNPNLNDRTIDLQWGFAATLLNGNFYSNHTATTLSNPFYFEGSLLHELGHARYLIDLYGFNVHDDGTGTTVAIRENGQLIVGTPYMPLLGGAVYFTPIDGLMNGQYHFIDEYSTVALNLIAGHRAVLGNYNAPGNIGVFLQDLPLENRLLVKDDQGNPVSGAVVEVYQAAPQSGVWYGKFYDDTPDLQLMTDSSGYVNLGRCPFSTTGTINHTYGHSNSVIILRIEKNGQAGYNFMEVTDLNMEYWRGNTTMGSYEKQFNLIDPLSLSDNDEEIIEVFALFANYPNPFNPRTVIPFQISERSQITIRVFNTLGEQVKKLLDHESYPPGKHHTSWDGTNEQGQPVSSGVYFYRMDAGQFKMTRKMILIR